jgi:branched-chain amino acid transport system permease protein
VLTQILINGLVAGLLWGLLAIGFSIVYGTARFFHVAHAGVYLVGAYTGICLANALGAPGLLVAIASMIAAVGMGLLIELGIYKPLRKAGSSSLGLFLSSLATLLIVQNSIAVIFGSEIKVVGGRMSHKSFRLLDATITSWQVLSCSVTLFLFVMTWLLLRYTITGKKMRAVANDPDLAEIVGINRNGTLLIAMCFGSALAGIAGFLMGYDTAVTPTIGFGVLLIAITAVVVGGIGSVAGAMLGGLMVGFAQNIGIWKLPAQWQDLIVFVILIIFLLLRPQGFLGKALRGKVG